MCSIRVFTLCLEEKLMNEELDGKVELKGRVRLIVVKALLNIRMTTLE